MLHFVLIHINGPILYSDYLFWRKTMSAPKLFSPGPVLVRDNVRHALLHYDICHRSTEFEQMFQETQSMINWLFQAGDRKSTRLNSSH